MSNELAEAMFSYVDVREQDSAKEAFTDFMYSLEYAEKCFVVIQPLDKALRLVAGCE